MKSSKDRERRRKIRARYTPEENRLRDRHLKLNERIIGLGLVLMRLRGSNPVAKKLRREMERTEARLAALAPCPEWRSNP